jgi:class 3 adenylate cyclase
MASNQNRAATNDYSPGRALPALTSVRNAGALVITLWLVSVLLAITPLAASLEEQLGLAFLFRTRGVREPPSDVVVVAIDRAASRALGQSERIAEWPRSLHAQLVDALIVGNASVIAFDISFATPARNLADDHALALALARAGNVVLLDLIEYDEPSPGLLLERRHPPLRYFIDVAAAHGPFPLPKESAVRAFWTARQGGEATLPILAWRVHRQSEATSTEGNARYLDFYGPPRTLRTIGFHEVLAAAATGDVGRRWLRDVFHGRAVFVGFSAADPKEQDRTRDDYRTVFSRADGLNLSGVEIAATAVANLLEDRAPSPLPTPAVLALLLASAGVLIAISATLTGIPAIASVLGAVALYMSLAYALFAATAQWLPLVLPVLVQAPLALVSGASMRYARARAEKQHLVRVLSDLLPATVVERLVNRVQSIVPESQAGYGVFLLTDVEGFTSIAERLSPTAASRVLNDYFALIFPAVERNSGTVLQINGDSILAFWVEAGDAGGARRAACRAACEIANVSGHSSASPAPGALPTRIGVHGGPFSLARLGAASHHEFRVVGDAANTTSRLEALAKQLGVSALVSRDVVAGLDELLTRDVGTFVLVGKSQAVRVHQIMGWAAAATSDEQRLCTSFEAALNAYRREQWTEARESWLRILQTWPADGPTHFYLERMGAATGSARDEGGVVRMAVK